MNAKGNQNSTIRLTSETVDYCLDREHRERLMAEGTQNRTLRLVRTPRHTARRYWLKIALFAALAALLLTPLSVAHAQMPWQNDGEGDFFHPAIVEYKMGLFHLVREEWELAIVRFDRAVTLLPEYAAAFEARGYCYDALGNAEQAEADYLQALFLTPDYGPTYKLLADLYYEQGEQGRALEQYRMYVALTGEDEGFDETVVGRVAELEAALG